MEKYKKLYSITEMGPYVFKLILQMPFEVKEGQISENSFNIYAEKREEGTEQVVETENFITHKKEIYRGFVEPWKVYPCDEQGNCVKAGNHVAIQLRETMNGLYHRIEGDVMSSRMCDNYFRITMLHAIDNDPLKSGLVFDECEGEICPQLQGWKTEKFQNETSKLNFSYYEPVNRPVMTLFGPKEDGNSAFVAGKKWPLIVWLHGAGEGGMDPRIPIWANRVSHLSEPDIQKFYDGAAYVLVPQCPTVWMDDGKEQLGHSNQSIYVKPLKKCIDAFVEAHRDRVDMDRIYVGGMSNGGFMTMRMIFDYPDYFAAAVPNCECFYSENISEEMLSSIKNIPTWFVHCKNDELVPARETAVPTYRRLKESGAKNVHITYYEYLYDFTGRYKDEFGAPMPGFNHAVWNNCLANECHTDMDGSNVLVDGEAVTIWEWVAKQKRN